MLLSAFLASSFLSFPGFPSLFHFASCLPPLPLPPPPSPSRPSSLPPLSPSHFLSLPLPPPSPSTSPFSSFSSSSTYHPAERFCLSMRQHGGRTQRALDPVKIIDERSSPSP